MVKLTIKKGDEAQFLYETTVQMSVEDLMKEIMPIYNGRLKIDRIGSGMVLFSFLRLSSVQLFVLLYIFKIFFLGLLN